MTGQEEEREREKTRREAKLERAHDSAMTDLTDTHIYIYIYPDLAVFVHKQLTHSADRTRISWLLETLDGLDKRQLADLKSFERVTLCKMLTCLLLFCSI